MSQFHQHLLVQLIVEPICLDEVQEELFVAPAGISHHFQSVNELLIVAIARVELQPQFVDQFGILVDDVVEFDTCQERKRQQKIKQMENISLTRFGSVY